MNKRKMIWALISFGIALFSIMMVIKQSKAFEPDVFLSNILKMDKLWLIGALISMFGFIWFEGLAIVRIARALDDKRYSKYGVVYGAADVYFSAITPSASGGQPASAYFMLKDGMSASVTATTLLFNLIMYSVALLSIGAVTFLLYGNMIFQLSIGFQALFGFGFIVMIILTFVFYLLLRREQIVYNICDGILRVLERIHLVKKGNIKRDKLKHTMRQYRECARIISTNKKMVFDAYILNVLQRLSQLAVSFCVFMACKKGFYVSLKAMAVQSFVAVGSNSMPIPGAMGVADYMILNGFSHLIGGAESTHMELMCRGINFYGCVITGSVITFLGYLKRKGKRVC